METPSRNGNGHVINIDDFDRRTSSRVKNRVNYAELLVIPEDDEGFRRRKYKNRGSGRGGKGGGGKKTRAEMRRDEDLACSTPVVDGEEGEDGGDGDGDGGLGVLEKGIAGILGWNEKSDHAKVKETIRLFNSFYLHFVQKEDQRAKKQGSKSQNGSGTHVSKRPDLKASTMMRTTKSVLFPRKRFGHLPGVDSGFQFFSRCEMVAVGVHTHWLKGIDYMLEEYGKLDEDYKNYVFPITLSIVMSGMYEDDQDNLENVVYTGEGGNNINGDKHQCSDQVMLRGNLALKNNIEQRVPVRVIRGHQCKTSYVGKVYTYDGLYNVIKYWAEKGISGYTVYKFGLKRIKEQPALTTNQVFNVHAQAPHSLTDVQGLVCDDISGGQEGIPVPATNLVDDPGVPPTGYSYCASVKVPKHIKVPEDAIGCGCNGDCTNPNVCACAKLNSGFPYVHKDGGRLIQAKSVVYECNPNCSCGPQCVNRISQRGLKYRLEVFRTPQKGWAVRSWDFIPCGAPVCEYTGLLKRIDEINDISENKYIFEMDCLQTMQGLEGRERRLGDVAVNVGAHLGKRDVTHPESYPEFCIDAEPAGGVARFINHSCEPNLFVQSVVSSHHDLRLARVVLVAMDNIPPLQELTYDYGYVVDSVLGADGKFEILPCYCGTPSCRKRLH